MCINGSVILSIDATDSVWSFILAWFTSLSKSIVIMDLMQGAVSGLEC
jgi:hypothetical protein